MCGKQTQRNVAWCGLHPFGTDLCTQHCTSTALYCAALYCAQSTAHLNAPSLPKTTTTTTTHTHTHTHTHTRHQNYTKTPPILTEFFSSHRHSTHSQPPPQPPTPQQLEKHVKTPPNNATQRTSTADKDVVFTRLSGYRSSSSPGLRHASHSTRSDASTTRKKFSFAPENGRRKLRLSLAAHTGPRTDTCAKNGTGAFFAHEPTSRFVPLRCLFFLCELTEPKWEIASAALLRDVFGNVFCWEWRSGLCAGVGRSVAAVGGPHRPSRRRDESL